MNDVIYPRTIICSPSIQIPLRGLSNEEFYVVSTAEEGCVVRGKDITTLLKSLDPEENPLIEIRGPVNELGEDLI
jgi:hypothetical protein